MNNSSIERWRQWAPHKPTFGTFVAYFEEVRREIDLTSCSSQPLLKDLVRYLSRGDAVKLISSLSKMTIWVVSSADQASKIRYKHENAVVYTQDELGLLLENKIPSASMGAIHKIKKVFHAEISSINEAGPINMETEESDVDAR